MAAHFDVQTRLIRPGLILIVGHPQRLLTRDLELFNVGGQQHTNRLPSLSLGHHARSQTDSQSRCTGPEPCRYHLRKSHPMK